MLADAGPAAVVGPDLGPARVSRRRLGQGLFAAGGVVDGGGGDLDQMPSCTDSPHIATPAHRRSVGHRQAREHARPSSRRPTRYGTELAGAQQTGGVLKAPPRHSFPVQGPAHTSAAPRGNPLKHCRLNEAPAQPRTRTEQGRGVAKPAISPAGWASTRHSSLRAGSPWMWPTCPPPLPPHGGDACPCRGVSR